MNGYRTQIFLEFGTQRRCLCDASENLSNMIADLHRILWSDSAIMSPSHLRIQHAIKFHRRFPLEAISKLLKFDLQHETTVTEQFGKTHSQSFEATSKQDQKDKSWL